MNVSNSFRFSLLSLACALALAGCGSSGNDSTPLDDMSSTPTGTNGDASGNGSGNGTGTGTDNGGAATPSASISLGNYATVLREAVVATNAVALETDAARVGALTGELFDAPNDDRSLAVAQPTGAGLTFLSEESFDQGRRLNYSCEAGGSMVLPMYEYAGPNDRRALEFDDCQLGGNRYDGDWTTSGGFELRNTAFNAFRAEFADGSGFAIDGDFESSGSRGFTITTEHWIDTDYSNRDAVGNELRLDGFYRERDATIALDFDQAWGQVLLDDGSSVAIYPRKYNGEVSADFGFSSSVDALGSLTVSSAVAFNGDFYDWSPQAPASGESIDVPAFPVSDLGSPLMLEGIDGAPGFSIEPTVAIPEGSEQWNQGTFAVTAADGSRVVMSPSADDAAQVEIRVNDADTPILRDWADGFQVKCAEAFAGCR